MKALTEVDRRLLAEKIDGRLVGWIHDELLVETREADVDRVKALLQEEMESAFVGTFPVATRNKLIEVKGRFGLGGAVKTKPLSVED